VGIPYGTRLETCPIRTLEEWLDTAHIENGPVFQRMNRWEQVLPNRLSAQSVALIIKEAAENAGLDKSKYSGHSLRSGSATQAAKGGTYGKVIYSETTQPHSLVYNRCSLVLHGTPVRLQKSSVL
jgi:hypothetical protein